jgi:transcriptional regulator with XRE-family HTH domain
VLLEVAEFKFLRRHHQITQRAVAERLGLSVSRVQQFEAKSFDPMYSTLIRFRDALYGIIEEKQRREAEEFAKRLRLVESDPKNAWLLEAYKKDLAYKRSHNLSWVKPTKARWVPKDSGGDEDSIGTTEPSAD